MTRIYTARYIKPDDGSWKRHDIQPIVPAERRGFWAHIVSAFKRGKRHD